MSLIHGLRVTPPWDTWTMEEMEGQVIRESERVTDSGEQVLEWLRSAEAISVARRQLQRSGFGNRGDHIADVVAEAQVGILTRMRSATPFNAENPAAYGTRVIQNVVKNLVRGDVVHLEDFDEHEVPEPAPVDRTVADDVRVRLEQADAPVWLTSAALAWVCLVMFPDAVPDSAPAPASGARPDQALGWPALWFAGERDLFPVDGSDPAKRKRARRIEKVREHVEGIFSRVAVDGETDDA